MAISFIKDLYRVTLNLPGLGATVFYPQNEVIQWKWARHKDYRQFILTCETELLFVDHESFSIDDFTKLYELERDPDNRCEAIDCLIERECNGGFMALFQGYLALIDGEWDVSRCRVTIQPRIYDPYECLERISKDVVNVLEAEAGASTVLAVNTISEDCQVQFQVPSNYTDEQILEELLAEIEFQKCVTGSGWHVDEYTLLVGEPFEGDLRFIYSVTWKKNEYVVECDGMGVPQPPTSSGDWILLEDNCAASGTAIWTSDTITTNVFVETGRRLEDVLNLFVDDCGLTIVSDFFNINPDMTAPDNDAYDSAAVELTDLRIVQMTDVKITVAGSAGQGHGPGSGQGTTTEFAKRGEMRLKDLLEDLSTIFNVDYIIEGTTLRIEHVSYFETYTYVTDFTQAKWLHFIAGNFKYSYRTDKLPRQENFNWAEEHDYVDVDFLGYPIVYNDVCNVTDEADEEQHKVNYFLTDWDWVSRNTKRQNEAAAAGESSGLKPISDDLFMLVSTNNSIINSTVGFNSGDEKINAALSWANLHQNYHRIGRPRREGEMNLQEQDFVTYNYPRNQEAFEFNGCCDNLFDIDPEHEKYRTQLGWGRIREATYEDPRQVMTFNLEHQ